MPTPTTAIMRDGEEPVLFELFSAVRSEELSMEGWDAEPIAAGTTTIQAAHLTELRDALSSTPASPTARYSNAAPDATMNAATIQMGGSVTAAAGGNQPHNNVQPYLALSYLISLYGVFPSQN